RTRPEPRPGGHPRRSLGAALTPAQWNALKDRAASLEVSPTALVLTAFAEVLAADAPDEPFTLVLTTSDRVRLPAGAEHLVGPFTSTALLAVPPLTDRSFDDAARTLHDRLWAGLSHTGVSGVEVLRELRSRDRSAPPVALPVVFTSLLETGTGRTGGFTDHLAHATSRTAGIALDHQMWEADGALHYRWDVADTLLAPGAADTLFTALGNTLRDLVSAPDEETGPLNQLQQAYYVARSQGAEPWDGCQVYHSFALDHLDIGRLEDTWHAMTERYDVLRTHLSHDGELRVRRTAGPRRRIPVVDLAAVEATGTPGGVVEDAFRDRMAGTAFPLGRWPQFDLRVTRSASGRATLHCALDLAVVDGRSLHLLLRELVAGYGSPAGRAPALPAPGAALAGELPGPPDPSAAAYWRERFTGLPGGPALAGGADRHRTRRSGVLTGWRRTRAAVERHGLTPDAALLAVLTEALSTRVDGDFTVVAARWHRDDEHRRPGEHTRLSWLDHGPAARSLVERATAHQHRMDQDDTRGAGADGLAELRRLVMRERAGTGLAFPVVHTGLLELTARTPPPGLRSGRWLTCTPGVSLDSICVEEGDELHYHWDTVPGDFAPGDLEAMFAAYERLLGAVGEVFAAAAPAGVPGPRERSAALTPDERERVLHTWNDTAEPVPDERPVHRFFEDHARRTPDATAVLHAGGSVSYRELDGWANGIAYRLRALGVDTGQVVAIRARRGPALIAAVLGVLKAGAAYLPIEPTTPAERAAGMLADAGAVLLLTTTDTGPLPVPDGVRVVEADRSAVVPADLAPLTTAQADSTAYVIFTSGSTGRPKGVAVAHRSVRNLLNWCWRTFDFGPRDLGLMVTSLAFDLSVFDIFGLLGRGAALYVADEAQQKDPGLLLDLLLEQPVTFWNSAPTTLAQVMPLLPAPTGDRTGTDHLRLVFLSGDYTPLSLPDELRAVFRSAELVSLGGATEATVWSNYHRVGEVDPAWRSVPYGRPIDNARYYVLDENLEPCPVGTEGDLMIGGDCLALGYHNRPELTGERFVADPFVPGGGQRMYRTGDRAAFGPDGVMTFLGRADSQVKIRGHRVELGEIEHRLRGHPGVREAVVLVRPHDSGDHKVVGYLLPDGEPPSVSELREYAARALPDYMVPNYLVFLDTLPATANGKLDRDALPWPLPGAASAGRPAVGVPAAVPVAGVVPEPVPVLSPMPRQVPVPVPLPVPVPAAVRVAVPVPVAAPAAGPVPTAVRVAAPVPETAGDPAARPEAAHAARLAGEIADMVSGLLDGRPVDPDQDLWDQGATSFTMVRISRMLRQRHGLRIPVDALLDAPTVTGIAARLATAEAPATASPTAP
ncbi:amino acid adenylation domain-containing protein, partial [Streptomyces sp. SID3212]|uniref:non-ribosomal peptide synthetase n=1 Tax=Streptomyces sp. SID3212 TaxID=2690259 RepID=UPI001368E615